MIDRPARLHEVDTKRLADGSRAHFVLLSLDEGERISIRISADEHARLEAALVAKRKFVMTLSIAAPTLRELTGGEGDAA